MELLRSFGEEDMRRLIRSLGLTTIVCLVIVEAALAQTFQRQATVSGFASPDHGQCRIEIVVDGAAEVEIRGVNATLRNLSGQSPQWRRFECSSAIPANPRSLRFDGVEGRG